MSASVRAFQEERGVVYVEFLIVFFPMFIMFLAITQLAFMYAAKLTLQHAALRGARAAIVVLDDDPKRYGGSMRGCLVRSGNAQSDSSGVNDGLGNFLNMIEKNTGTTAKQADASEAGGSAGNEGGSNATLDKYRRGGPRINAIRSAVYVPLITLAPDLDTITSSETLESAVGDNKSRIASSVVYNMGATAVTFPTAPGGDKFRVLFGKNDLVTVRVEFLFPCIVPLAAALMCDNVWKLAFGDAPEKLQNIVKDAKQEKIPTREKVNQWSTELDDAVKKGKEQLNKFTKFVQKVEQPGLGLLWIMNGGYFKVLSAEASLPNQGADYLYKEEAEAARESSKKSAKSFIPSAYGDNGAREVLARREQQRKADEAAGDCKEEN